MPVYKMEEEMPYIELLKWINYFKSRPPGWREDQRAYLHLRTQGVKEPAETIFPSLKSMADSIPTEENALPKGKFLDMMLKATEGDESGWSPPWVKKNENKSRRKRF